MNMASPPYRGGSERQIESHGPSNPNTTGGRPPAAQLEFTQAMTDFKVMFPDMDTEVIEAVLRANNGAVDATIDHLLTMSADNEAEKLLHEEPGSGAIAKKGRGEPEYTGNPPSYQQATQEEEVDLINLGGACAAPLPKKTNLDGDDILSDFSMITGNQLHSIQEATKNQQQQQKQQRTSVDLLSDLDLSGVGSSTQPFDEDPDRFPTNSVSQSQAIPSSSPKLAYSHPSRQTGTLETLSLYPQTMDSSNNIRDNSTTGMSPSMQNTASGTHSSMIPTQQQLQEIYEENLRMREEAKSAFNQSPQALLSSNSSGAESKTLASQRQQFLEDERVALMLQNEEFMAELRRDHEFMSALESEDQDASRVFGGNGDSLGADATHGGASGLSSSSLNRGKPTMMDEAVFREKLKNMGKTSKRKFSQLASMFSRRKGAKQLLGHAPAPSKDNLLLNAEPLVNDFDSDDDTSAAGKSSGNDSVMNRQPKTPNKGKYTSFS